MTRSPAMPVTTPSTAVMATTPSTEGTGDDVLTGGSGNDYLNGGSGNDTYLFSSGWGQDQIYNSDSTSGRRDVIRFTEGVSPADLTLRRSGDQLIIKHANGDQIQVSSYFLYDAAGGYQLNEIQFADGTVWDVEYVKAAVLASTSGDDTLQGYASNDVLAGGAGDDTLTGNAGNDALDGGSGDDALYGNAGNDMLTGGAGNDYLNGGSGNDTYLFSSGWGQDQIYNSDSTSGRRDVIRFTEGVSPTDLTLHRSGDQLIIKHANGDQIQVSSYFLYDAAGGYQINEIQFADGTTWDVEHVKAAVLASTSGDDTLQGYASNDVLAGGAGDDTLTGNAGNDALDGGSGDDALYGNAGNDMLTGGAGNDYLNGGSGNDTYLFSSGWGQDQIYNSDSTSGRRDVIRFTEGVSPTDLTLRRSGDQLIIKHANGDQIQVSSYFLYDAAGGYQINEIQFADGTTWDVEHVKAAVLAPTSGDDTLQGYASNDVLAGGAGDDTLTGNAGNDALDGGSGDDALYGNAGNDMLTGGAGNDYLNGGSGNDTYLFSSGWGQDQIYNSDSTSGRRDVIRFTEGVSPTDLTLRRSGDQLIIKHANGDQIQVSSYFLYDAAGGYQINEIQFADGTTWDVEHVKAAVLAPTSGDDTLQGYASNDVLAGGAGDDRLTGNAGNDTLDGGDGNDTLYGNGGNDMLTGGAGNDYLEGGSGNDTYVFGSGWGQDQIRNYDTASGRRDVIRFTEGVSPADLTLRRSGDQLVIKRANGDQIQVSSYFLNDAAGGYQINEIQFADGTVWDVAHVKAAVLAPTSGDDNLQGYASNDVLAGGAGDDTLTGNAGNDTLDGGSGEDVLYGNAGSDVLTGGIGNDYLDGGSGSDTYRFSIGDGADQIDEYDSSSGAMDYVEFTDLNSNAIGGVERSGNDLILRYGGSDSITVDDHFRSSTYGVEGVKFADGVSWTRSDLEARVASSASKTTATVRSLAADTGSAESGPAPDESPHGKWRRSGDKLMSVSGRATFPGNSKTHAEVASLIEAISGFTHRDAVFADVAEERVGLSRLFSIGTSGNLPLEARGQAVRLI